MLKRIALFAAPLLAVSTPLAAQETAPPATTDVVMETSLGAITLTLETRKAPVTSANFLRYVDERRFDGTVFYRAMTLDWGTPPNGLIQGGTRNDPDRILPPIAHEPTDRTGLRNVAGAITMARYEPGSATGDFSIMVSDLPSLDADPASDDPDSRAGFAAFGHVSAGMDVVRAIFEWPIDPDKGEGWMKGQLFAEPVAIVTVRRVETP